MFSLFFRKNSIEKNELTQKLNNLLALWDNLFFSISDLNKCESYLKPIKEFTTNDLMEDVYDYKINSNKNAKKMDHEFFFILVQKFCIEVTKFLKTLYNDKELKEILYNEPFLSFLDKHLKDNVKLNQTELHKISNFNIFENIQNFLQSIKFDSILFNSIKNLEKIVYVDGYIYEYKSTIVNKINKNIPDCEFDYFWRVETKIDKKLLDGKFRTMISFYGKFLKYFYILDSKNNIFASSRFIYSYCIFYMCDRYKTRNLNSLEENQIVSYEIEKFVFEDWKNFYNNLNYLFLNKNPCEDSLTFSLIVRKRLTKSKNLYLDNKRNLEQKVFKKEKDLYASTFWFYNWFDRLLKKSLYNYIYASKRPSIE